MDILKTATDWAKTEAFASTYFILFGVMFVVATIGFWQFGKTELAKAYIFPTLIAGTFLLVVGLGLFFTNKSRISSFETAYNTDAPAFVQSEIDRADKTLNEYKTIALTVFPIVVIVAALLIIFVDTPLWRAIGITTIALMTVIMLVDSNANARHENYKEQLLLVEKDLKN
ncbi:MAG: hypothetical protein DWQ02_20945 [Bacteroidetes bacterium]|nr:MAG: hypothetical protein DWQ02_20945 [Bacteroidota bacterium]